MRVVLDPGDSTEGTIRIGATIDRNDRVAINEPGSRVEQFTEDRRRQSDHAERLFAERKRR